MNRKTIRCFLGILCLFAFLAPVQAEEKKFVLQGEGRDTDMTSTEKNVSPDQNLVITITGNSRYKMQSKGKLSLYTDARQKIKEVRFALQPGEAKVWEFQAEKKIQLVGLGVYGKGEIKVVLQQGEKNIAQAETAAKPGIAGQAPTSSGTATAAKSSASGSGSFPLLLKEAEKSYLGGNKLEAVEKLKQAVLDIWDEVPLTIKNVKIVENTKTYAVRKNNVFRSGEKMHFSAQMFGYKLKQVGGAYSINITTDVYFLREGKILVGQQNFGKFNFISPLPNTEFRLDLTYWLTEAPPGVYDVQSVVHDQNTGQSTKFTTQIEMK